jgi:hypothetical protein
VITDRAMFRYEVPIDDEAHKFRLRGNPVAVAMATSGRAVEFWAEHDTSQSECDQAFRVYGTGHPLPADAEWVGTCPRTPDGLVWHLFEVTP